MSVFGILLNAKSLSERAFSNPTLSASISESRQMLAKSQIASRLCYSASLLSKIQQTGVLKRMNPTVKLYRSVKHPSGAWGTQPVPDNQLRTLKDLREGQGGESGRRRTRFRSEGEHHSGVNPNSIPF